ncbi:MAG: hypothetical protein HYS34_02580, partial [Acidobacteria bacterium]|nr:hypothetical protein [Acidobacteriota bacterium]
RPGLRGFSLTLPLVALLSLACADKTPARITFTAPPPVIVSGKTLVIKAALVNRKDEPIAGKAVAFSAAPADVLEVSATGTLRCLKTGDATLTLAPAGGAGTAAAGTASGGASAGSGAVETLAVKCRLPTAIVLPQDLRLVLGSKPVPLHPRVLGDGGIEMQDVPLEITSSDPSVVAIEEDAAKPVAVGRARLRAAAEEIAGVAPVEVVERIVSEPLALADGARRAFRLEPGEYEVTVDMKSADRITQGVTVAWEGAACDPQPEKPSHRFRCRVNEPATMTVANPAQIGLGARMTGTVAIYRVPPA